LASGALERTVEPRAIIPSKLASTRMPPIPDRPGKSVPPDAPADSRRAAEARATRVEQITADIATRLRRVCAHLSEDQFAALVREIADVKLRYEEREAHGSRRNVDRPKPESPPDA
jgi:hypothetical protein